MLINNIAGMGIRINKLRQIINYMEENQFDILLVQEANVDFKHKTTQTYIERMLKQKYHITVSETPFCATTVNKPGGTFVITGTPLKSRIANNISDESGRWV
jgi:exonuclease III